MHNIVDRNEWKRVLHAPSFFWGCEREVLVSRSSDEQSNNNVPIAGLDNKVCTLHEIFCLLWLVKKCGTSIDMTPLCTKYSEDGVAHNKSLGAFAHSPTVE